MRRALLTVTCAALFAAALARAAEARGPVNYVIHLGKGAGGVALGDTRSTVLRKLGRPLSENQPGTMSYFPVSSFRIFDVYREFNSTRTQNTRVRMVVVSDERFRSPEGMRLFAPGALRRLKRRHPTRLRAVRAETGEIIFRYRTTFRGAPTQTDFFMERPRLSSRVLTAFTLFASGSPPEG